MDYLIVIAGIPYFIGISVFKFSDVKLFPKGVVFCKSLF